MTRILLFLLEMSSLSLVRAEAASNELASRFILLPGFSKAPDIPRLFDAVGLDSATHWCNGTLVTRSFEILHYYQQSDPNLRLVCYTTSFLNHDP